MSDTYPAGTAAPLWGPETAKALANFGPGSIPRRLIGAYAQVKLAAVRAVQATDAPWEAELFACLEAALREVEAGALDAHFPLPLRQGGAGTSLNMNLNEVAAARARALYLERHGREAPPLDPIEDVNRRQSTNDTFPAAVTIMALGLVAEAEAGVIALQEALVAAEARMAGLVVTGRTELQDALPMGLGQVFGSWAGAAERDRWRLHKVRERLRTHGLGGTALGTCFGATPAYLFAADRELRRITGLPLARSQNLPDETANQDKLAEAAGALGLSAGNLGRLASDLLLYTSSLSGELVHPTLQHGSTIMPVKANPVLLEYARGEALAAAHAAESARDFAFQGQLQLNPWLPWLAAALLEAGESLQRGLGAMARLLGLLEARPAALARRLVASAALLNLLSPDLGYHRTKALAADLATPAATLIATMGESSTTDEVLRAYARLVGGASGLPEDLVARRFGAALSPREES